MSKDKASVVGLSSSSVWSMLRLLPKGPAKKVEILRLVWCSRVAVIPLENSVDISPVSPVLMVKPSVKTALGLAGFGDDLTQWVGYFD